MSHSSQPVLRAPRAARERSPDRRPSRNRPPPCISAMPKPPPAVNTGNTRLCAVSLASSVVVMVTPLAHGAGRFGGEQRLAAQHAVLIGEGEAHHFELVLLDRALDLARRARLLVASTGRGARRSVSAADRLRRPSAHIMRADSTRPVRLPSLATRLCALARRSSRRSAANSPASRRPGRCRRRRPGR